MTENERWEQLVLLDEKYLEGGIILSEWCSFLCRDTELAYASGAFLSTIITAVAGIEAYLRSEYKHDEKHTSLFKLIKESPIEPKLKEDIQVLRKYRNKWVHIDNPWEDEILLEKAEDYEKQIEEMALFAIDVLLRTIYENPWI